MKCPHCGNAATAQGERCSNCGRSHGPARAAAAVLTPIPGTSDTPFSSEASDRRAGPPGPATSGDADDDFTRLVHPDDVIGFAPGRMDASDDDATRLVMPEDVGRLVVPDEVTRLVAPGQVPSIADDEATRFVPPPSDVTRFVSPSDEATRFVAPADEETRFVSAEADDATRLVTPDGDATRFVDDPGASPSGELTRLADPPPARTGAASAKPGPRATAASTTHSGPLVNGQVFGRYHIIRVLGEGGMGAVYHAWDGELGATVALKVIRPEATRNPATARELERRFKQELVLARKVTHKNVVRIHDLGEISGIKFISMPYLEGSDLASVLKERQTLPVPEALRIVRDVAAGLVAAHESGIVHRDLKPANIMVQKELAIIMDFGIARSTATPEAPVVALPASMMPMATAATEMTMAGTIVGTVQYMSPEQARGEAADQRADVYALGLIFADMLVGKSHRGAPGVSPLDELRRRIEHPTSSVHSIDPKIPEALSNLIAKCVNPDPAARFQTSQELVDALDRLDANGEVIKVRKVVGLPLVTAIALALLALSGGVWWYQKSLIPPPAIPPMSLVIADFDNKTGDPAFDRTLEPMLRMALEQASFISAYDRASISRFLTSGVQVPPTLNGEAATELALKQGVNVVVSGSVERQSQGFTVTLRAARPLDAKVLLSETERAASKDEVLSSLAQLAANLRSAVGDDTSDSRFSSRTNDPITATSLEVVSKYALGMESLSKSQNADALKAFQQAVTIDSDFGLAYAGMAIASRNLDKEQDAVKYVNEAIRHLDRMTTRERFRTRGLVYLITRDYRKCVEEYGALTEKYPGDAAAYNNLALCASHLRDFAKSLKARQKAKTLVPKRSVYRFNLAIDSTYAGEFTTGEAEARAALGLGSNVLGAVALAFSQVAQGHVKEARATLDELANSPGAGASRARAGLAELAAYEGRYSDAAKLFEEGAKADVAANNQERASDKLVGLAYVQLMMKRTAAARAAAARAIAANSSPKILFLAGRIFAETGDAAGAQQAITALASEIQDEPQALAKILMADLALAQGKPQLAIRPLEQANGIIESSTGSLDTWIGRFDLGRAYLAAGLLTQADSEFDRCLTRRGEALSLFLDDEPTFAFLPALYYYQGRVREELKTAAFADSYRTYLSIRGAAAEDPLLADVRRRAGN